MLFLSRKQDHHHDDDHDDHGGLYRDLLETNAAMDRRGMFRVVARFGVAFGAVQLIGCGADAAALVGTDNPGSTSCPAKVPEETAGPFPGDSSNGPNVLNQTSVVRQDIRSSFAGLTGTAAGVLLNLELTIVSASTCSPLADYAVYLWHCDRAGNYSLYSSGVTNQNYLRGVQAANASGVAKFTTIFPGCYAGRWPHMHFEVYKKSHSGNGGLEQDRHVADRAAENRV
jgi:protocatechuate 3,4-dioxygenase beta subunit